MSGNQKPATDVAGYDLVTEITKARRAPRIISLDQSPDGMVTLTETASGITHRLPVVVHRAEARELATALVACWSPATPVALVKLAMALLAAEAEVEAGSGRGSGGMQ